MVRLAPPIMIIAVLILAGCGGQDNKQFGTESPAEQARNGGARGLMIINPGPEQETIRCPATGASELSFCTKLTTAAQYQIDKGAIPTVATKCVKPLPDSQIIGQASVDRRATSINLKLSCRRQSSKVDLIGLQQAANNLIEQRQAVNGTN